MKKLLGILTAAALLFSAVSCAQDDGVMTMDEAYEGTAETDFLTGFTVPSTLSVGEGATATIAVTNSKGTPDSELFTLKSYNEDYVTVASSGLTVNGVAVGSAVVVVSYNGTAIGAVTVSVTTDAITHTLDFSTITKGGTDGYFTASENVNTINASYVQIKTYDSTKGFRGVSFTTAHAGATITIEYTQSGSATEARYVTVGTTEEPGASDVDTVGVLKGASTTYGPITLGAAGTYYIGCTVGDIRLTSVTVVD